MSLASPYSEVYQVASGSTAVFPFGQAFTPISKNYVKCIVYFQDGTNVVPTFIPNMEQGSITIVALTLPDGTPISLPPAGSIVRIFRDVPESQDVTASQLKVMTAKQLEKSFDDIVAMIQEVSYSDQHKTLRLTETQRDVFLQKLGEAEDKAVLMWDNEKRSLVASRFTEEAIEAAIDYAVQTANEAKVVSEEAKTISQEAIDTSLISLGKSNEALSKSEQAITTSESAMDVAEQASEHADSALSLSQVALSNSQEAVQKADRADTTSARAEAKSDQAVATSEQALAGVQSAIEAAESATTAAQQATEVAERAEREIQTYDGRITEAQNNASQALSQVGNKQDKLVSGTNIKTINSQSILGSGNIAVQSTLVSGTNIKTINGQSVLGAGNITVGGAVNSVNGKTGTVVLTGEDISADVSELTDTIQGHLQTLHDNIKDIELFKFPNATIIGSPTIDHGQVSGFTANDYLRFPFIVDLHNQPFVIDFCFTTGNDVTTQQNILDSQFGLALAIANGKGLMAISHNGTSWAGSVVGTRNILPNTTYYARLSWNRINYKTELSTDGITYVSDMNFGSTQSPYPRTMFIGGCSGSAIGHTPHPFKGTINLNYAYLTVSGNVIWQGMDDAGLATRADISLDNLDELGQAKFDAKQNKLIAGQNIVIDETTNTISATGGADGESIKNQNASSSIEKTYDWTGTLQQAIDQNVRALHPDWKIFITDDVAGGESVYTKTEVDGLFAVLYPVGSIYIGTQSTCPLTTLIPNSTWELVATDRALWGGNGSNGNTTIAAGLPNITGYIDFSIGGQGHTEFAAGGAFYADGSGSYTYPQPSGESTVPRIARYSASRSSSIYGSSTTVQPPAYRVNVWRRTA